MGFQLYDEIFDYSFDSIVNTDERFNAFCNSVNSVLRMPINRLLQKTMDPNVQRKLEHNRNLAWNLNTYDPIMDRYKFFNEDQMTK